MAILVTGAGGFAGGHLVRLLISARTCIDRDATAFPRVRAMVRRPEQASHLVALGAEEVVADLTDRDSLRKALVGVKQVFHIGALFRQAGLPDQAFYDVNVTGTLNLFEESIAAGVERIVHCSTVGVLGDIAVPPGDELTAYAPGDIYQKTKMEGEQIALRYFRSGKIGGVVIRPAMIYGPGDTRTLKMFKAVARNRFFYVGKGDKRVHFVDVRDLAQAFMLAMSRMDRNGEVYIIAGRESKPLEDVAAAIADYFDVPAPWLHVPVFPVRAVALACELVCIPLRVEPPLFRRRVDFFTKHREFNWDKAKRGLCYNPRNSFHEEIREICSWYVDNGWISTKCPAAEPRQATIVRDISGRISEWNAEAEKRYGWKAGEAIGAVTHNLFKTEFPFDLEAINRQVLSAREWEGQLIHTTREGEKIRVHSRWEYVSHSPGTGFVIERNRFLDRPSGERAWDRVSRRAAALLPALPELIESGVFGIAATV